MASSTECSKSHVTIDTAAAQPHHGFVEKIHTPHHANPRQNMSVEDWDAEKHAHIAAEVLSPHGNVVREPTPIAKPVDGGFDEASPLKPKAADATPFAWNTAATAFACVGVAATLVLGNLRFA
eukprot:CAMPEP_0174854106 /NCGR_PEP_ID=MMETSP1114-20130205/30004_1 /TAXON_ID=312471 /ORGANISM="Neobodo designis, Strain CCAP 1951/1" /LENGTH=122 /DNA_ID=CAMNT_0016088779 /DNA_START=171 /DNA_END=539 /DNA_ORIENTATION=+